MVDGSGRETTVKCITKVLVILTLKHVHVYSGRWYVLRLARVIAAVRCVRVRHDEVAFRAVDVHDESPVSVEINHPIGMVPEHEQRSLGGSLQPAYQSEAAAAHYVQVWCTEDLRSGLCGDEIMTMTMTTTGTEKKSEKNTRTRGIINYIMKHK